MEMTSANPFIPEWLRSNINTECPYCGGPIVDDGPIGNNGVMLLTQRFCANSLCPGHMAHKIDILAKKFGVKGFGPETALSLCKSYKFRNHLEVLKIWFPDKKPLVHLWEVGDMAMLYGYSGSWRDLLLGYKDFTDFFENSTEIPPLIQANKNYLLYCQSYFDLKKPLSKNVIYVMMTGSIQGYSNRAKFIAAINDTFGSYVQVIDVGKRARNVHFLIKEEGSVDHSKSDLAMRNGIQIITPKDFLKVIASIVKEMIDKCESENS